MSKNQQIMHDSPADSILIEYDRILDWISERSKELYDEGKDDRSVKLVNLKSKLKSQRRAYEEIGGSFDVVHELEVFVEWTDTVLNEEVVKDEFNPKELARLAEVGEHVNKRLMKYRE